MIHMFFTLKSSTLFHMQTKNDFPSTLKINSKNKMQNVINALYEKRPKLDSP